MKPDVARLEHRASAFSSPRLVIGCTVAVLCVWSVVAAPVAFRVAALISGARWVSIEAVMPFERVGALVSDPANPSAAWGTGRVAGWVFWSLFALSVLGPVAAVTRVWSVRVRRRNEWVGMATKADLAKYSETAAIDATKRLRPSLSDPTAAAGALALGQSKPGGVDLWIPKNLQMVAVGPSQVGKTSRLVIPAALSHQGPVVITSTRPDVLSATRSRREELGRVWVLDPQGLVPDMARWVWSPARGCDDDATAIIRATSLVESAGGGGGVENAKFWDTSAKAVLRALLQAAAIADMETADWLQWCSDPDDQDPVSILTVAGRHTWAATLRAAQNGSPLTRSNVWAVVANAVEALMDAKIREFFGCRPSESVSPTDFLSGENTLFVVGSSSSQQSVAPLVAATVEDLTETGRRLAAGMAGVRLDPPLGLILDECANIAPLPTLPKLVSDGGGSGIWVLWVVQSLAQVEDRWGEDPARSAWDATPCRVVFGGGADQETLSAISKLVGEFDESVTTETWSPGHGRGMHIQAGVSVRRRDLFSVARIAQMVEGEVLVLARGVPPIVSRLPGYWETK